MQEGIFDKFVAKLKATFEGVKVGDPTDPSTQLGAQIYKSQQEKVLKYIKIGLEEGGELTNRVAYEDLVNTEFAKKALER